FDTIEPNRAKVLANTDTLLMEADRAARERTSNQHSFLGGDEHGEPALRLVAVPPWSRAEQMAAEREAFGFYFAAHPVEQYRAIASANGARSYASLTQASVANGRQPAVMAALVEGVNKGRTRKGSAFIRADFS